MKRPQRWQLEKQRTAKAMRSLLLCEQCGIKRAFGIIRDGATWKSVCPSCAADVNLRYAQRAQRERT